MYYNKIPVETIKEIQPLFNEVISYSQGIDINKIHSDKTFANWALNKVFFYRAFGNQCIHEFGEVEVHMSMQAKENEFQSFIRWLNRTHNYKVISCLTTYLLDKITPKEFFENKTDKILNIKTYDEEEKTLPAGTKVIRAFKFFISDEIKLRQIQDKASEIIQQDKTKGVLCLSIHPLDFLSLSENASNWRSCHALDGEFRAGNLSYLMDKSTIVAYIKSKEDKKIPRFPFPWNDKKWRNLLFFDECHTTIFAGRPYPYSSLGALTEVKKALGQLPTFDAAAQSNWRQDRIINLAYETYNEETEERNKTSLLEDEAATEVFILERHMNKFIYNPSSQSIHSIESLMKENQNQFCHYNDLLYSSTYFPLYLSLSHYPFLKPKGFEIGHEAYCLVNENHIIDPERRTDLMICDDCAEEYDPSFQIQCACCGNSVSSEDAIYVEDVDMYVCSRCYEHNMGTCGHCGRNVPINFLYTNKNNSEQHLCLACLFNKNEEERKEWRLII